MQLYINLHRYSGLNCSSISNPVTMAEGILVLLSETDLTPYFFIQQGLKIRYKFHPTLWEINDLHSNGFSGITMAIPSWPDIHFIISAFSRNDDRHVPIRIKSLRQITYTYAKSGYIGNQPPEKTRSVSHIDQKVVYRYTLMSSSFHTPPLSDHGLLIETLVLVIKRHYFYEQDPYRPISTLRKSINMGSIGEKN
jgi:hypothetical protein